MRQHRQFRPGIAWLFLGTALLSPVVSLPARAESPKPVTVVIARTAAVTEQVSVVGSILPREEVRVFPTVAGREIREIRVEAGQRVEKGDVLAVLDRADVDLQLARNTASHVRARAAIAVEAARVGIAQVTVAETVRVLNRSQSLKAQNVLAEQLLDQHRAAHDRATTELELARQSLALAEADAELVMRERGEIDLAVERSMIRAPMAGLVLTRAARVGAMTSISAEPLFVIAEGAEMEFVATVVETIFSRLQDGMPAAVSVAGSDGTIAGTIARKAAALDTATRSGTVHVRLQSGALVTPGMFGEARIDLSRQRNILLPASAVRTARNRSAIYVVTDGVVSVRDVAIGIRQGGFVEVLSDLADGEMVVAIASAFLKADDKVQPVVVAVDRADGDELAASLLITDETKERN